MLSISDSVKARGYGKFVKWFAITKQQGDPKEVWVANGGKVDKETKEKKEDIKTSISENEGGE